MKHSRKMPAVGHYRVLFEVGCLSGLSDGELLAGFLNREGDTAELAFAALVERHARMVMRICRAILRNEHDAEDAFQATFLVLATKAGRLRVRESLGPWLSAVARRIGRGARATALARVARELRAAKLAVTHAARAQDDEDFASVLHEEIDRLPERYRLPLLLCDLESQSHQEAARRLGWPLGTVKSRQARARERLRARLSRRGLSSSLPAGLAFSFVSSSIPDNLILSTASAAVRLVRDATAAQAVSASVRALVTHSLRCMIMTRLSLWVGVLLTISVGVAATVMAQTAPNRDKTPGGTTPAALAPITAETGIPPVFEFEIKVWKDGAPVTPAMKVVGIPGEQTLVPTIEGTVELHFHPRAQSLPNGGDALQPEPTAADPRDAARTADPRDAARTAARARLAQETLRRKQQNANLAEIAAQLVRQAENANRTAVLEQAMRRLDNPIIHQVGLGPVKRESTANDEHEKRLAEIERKLERILGVLEPKPATTRETHAVPR